jgi:hypothetical protein
MNYVLTNYFTFKTKPNVQNGVGFIISHLFRDGKGEEKSIRIVEILVEIQDSVYNKLFEKGVF